MSHEPLAVGCAYSVAADCGAGCKPKEPCPLGWVVYRRWSGGGHHHMEENE